MYITILIPGIEPGSRAWKSGSLYLGHTTHAEMVLKVSIKHSSSISTGEFAQLLNEPALTQPAEDRERAGPLCQYYTS